MTPLPLIKINDILDLVRHYPDKDRKLIAEAFAFADSSHKGQFRKAGEPYIQHSLYTGLTLAQLELDSQAISAGLLHDVPEDTPRDIGDIRNHFGKEIASLVNGVTKLGQIKLQISNEQDLESSRLASQVENLRKMILAMSKDIRVILIKLADRLHNMETLDGVEEKKRRRIAEESVEIYAALAGRLGMGELKGKLEDLAFPYLAPQDYQEVKKILRQEIPQKYKFVRKAQKIIAQTLHQNGIKIVDINGRVKHCYSFWKKLLRNDLDISKIYDLVAIRIIVPTINDCYWVLGVIHKMWKPLPGRIKDYIAMPKPNGYQSLHTTVFGPQGKIIELQIRTPAMHAQAEYGIASHWHYKEEGKKAKKIKIDWLKELARWQKRLKDPREFSQNLRSDFFGDRIFVFTPKGEVKNLPAGATPIDFAFSVHSEVGFRCTGAKVNGKIHALDSSLQNGDIVEILISKNAQPRQDWLNFVKSNNARYHIKKWVRRNVK